MKEAGLNELEAGSIKASRGGHANRFKDPPKLGKVGSNKRKMTKKKVREALVKHHGIKAAVCRDLKVDYQNLVRFIKNNPELREYDGRVKDLIMDAAEERLYEQVRAGDPEQVRFAIRMAGRKRGYGESVRHDGVQTGGSVSISFQAGSARLGASSPESEAREVTPEQLEESSRHVYALPSGVGEASRDLESAGPVVEEEGVEGDGD